MSNIFHQISSKILQISFTFIESTSNCVPSKLNYCTTNYSTSWRRSVSFFSVAKWAKQNFSHFVQSHPTVQRHPIWRYLSVWRQVVCVGGETSSTAITSCGVPQGSVLGPLIFLIAINDLPFSVNSDIFLVLSF
jgi:hypothetical protein